MHSTCCALTLGLAMCSLTAQARLLLPLHYEAWHQPGSSVLALMVQARFEDEACCICSASPASCTHIHMAGSLWPLPWYLCMLQRPAEPQKAAVRSHCSESKPWLCLADIALQTLTQAHPPQPATAPSWA